MLNVEDLEKLSDEEIEYQKTEGFSALWKCMTKITGDLGVWQEHYMNLSVELCKIFYEKGIICVCDADSKRILYGWEEI